MWASQRRLYSITWHAAGSPRQKDSSPAPHTHYAKMSSASAGGHPLELTIQISRRGETTPRGSGIPGAHASTVTASIEPGSRLSRDQACDSWLWARAHVRAWALGQSPLGALLLAWRLEHGLDVSVTATVGAGRSVAGGGAALERRSLERRRHAAGSPHQRDSSPTPHTHYAKMSSASAGGPQPTTPLNNGRREKPHLPRPRSVPPAPLTLVLSPVPFC